MDLGYGFEIKTTKITGLIVIFGSVVLTVFFYLIGKFFFQNDQCNKKMDIFKNQWSNTDSINVVVYYKFYKNL